MERQAESRHFRRLHHGSITSPNSSSHHPLTLPAAFDPQQLEAIAQSVPGGLDNIQDIYALAPLQEGMLFHCLLNEPSDTYIFSTLIEFQSNDDLLLWIGAANRVIQRHDVLRTSIDWEHSQQPLQVVHRRAQLQVHRIPVQPDRDVAQQLQDLMKPGRQQALNLRVPPLMAVLTAEDPHTKKWYALLQIHHLITDLQSIKLLLEETSAFIKDDAPNLPAPQSYRNYVDCTIACANHVEAERFFRDRLAGIDEPTAPFGLLDVHADGISIDETHEAFDPTLSLSIREEARRSGVSPARLFHAAWALVVARTSGRHNIVFGTVLSAARSMQALDLRCVMGLTINTLPLALHLGHASAKQLLQQTTQELSNLIEHVHSPLTLARRCSSIAGTAPLFTSLINFRRSGHELNWTIARSIRVLARGEARTNYPITISIDDRGGQFLITARTDGRLSPSRIVGYLRTATQSLVVALSQAPDTPALELAVVPESERSTLLNKFNSTHSDFRLDGTIHRLFELQASQTPDAVAVVQGDHSLSFAELNARSNQLARYLHKCALAPGGIAAIYLERSLDLIVALFAILKSGAAYLPLDPTNPRERVKRLISDSKPLLLITSTILAPNLLDPATEILTIDDKRDRIALEADHNLPDTLAPVTPGDLAYVIYTSGSTGSPKGVMIEHRSIVNYSLHISRLLDLRSGNGSLIATSASFDLMLTGLYPPLLAGRPVRLCAEHHGVPALADEVVRCRGLAPLKLTPSHLALLEQPLRGGALLDSVHVLVLGGEPLKYGVVGLWQKHAPKTRIFNHYGPTETTVGCLVHEIDKLPDHASGTVPVGRPISNTRVYVLDAKRQLVPIGAVGEIYISGAGVSRGYLNRPDLTDQRFFPDPFSDHAGARMYKTGDLGRWQEDGLIEFLGRNDDQVKIRGYRVELSEIEVQLCSHERVRNVAVIANPSKSGDLQLVAYVAQHTSAEMEGILTATDLRAHLRARLPEFMIPSSFVFLSTLPMTANGKLDKRSLPAPPPEEERDITSASPVGEAQELLCEIWRDLLGRNRIAQTDHFFDIGGHSLLAMRVVSRIAETFGIDIPLHAIFDNPTLERLAEYVNRQLPIATCMEST